MLINSEPAFEAVDIVLIILKKYLIITFLKFINFPIKTIFQIIIAPKLKTLRFNKLSLYYNNSKKKH